MDARGVTTYHCISIGARIIISTHPISGGMMRAKMGPFRSRRPTHLLWTATVRRLTSFSIGFVSMRLNDAGRFKSGGVACMANVCDARVGVGGVSGPGEERRELLGKKRPVRRSVWHSLRDDFLAFRKRRLSVCA